MKYKPTRLALLVVLMLMLTLVSLSLADEGGEGDVDMSDEGGNVSITDGGMSSVGAFSATTGDELSVSPEMLPFAMLTRADYQDVYDEAQRLLTIGLAFRKGEIQVPAPDAEGYVNVIDDVEKTYQDFNDGELFYRFCADYEQIDEEGYCPESDDIRNQMIRARELFAFLSLAEPFDTQVQAGGETVGAREIGRDGVLEATRELANIHMIFGNEFLVDALDYRFGGSTAGAEPIIEEEIEQLNMALQQYSQAVNVLTHALNADFGGPHGAYIADYFTEREFELFAIASERMVMVMDEIALRYRQLGRDEEAIQLYAEGTSTQYVQALALAQKAAESDVEFMNNGGWEIATNLGDLRARAQAVRDGLNPFGFTEHYVPLHGYAQLSTLTRSQLLQDATEDESEARQAQREFDRNATALKSEMQNLRLTYENNLLELCGTDVELCDGGLMEQNFINMQMASQRIALVEQRVDQIPEKIKIEQERADEVIEVTVEGGNALSALSYAIGVRGAYRVTKTVTNQNSTTWQSGVRGSIKFSFNPFDWFGGGLSAYSEVNHSRSRTTSVSKTWDPSQKEIGRLNGLRDVQNAATQARITGANSEAAIRNLLLQQADLMIELDIAVEEWNRLSAEHNHLVEKYHNMLNLKAQAEDNLLESYLNKPSYRILRDSFTVEASRSHALAAQFAYLTAKSLEYEFLTPVPFMNDIFMARSADDVDNFLVELEQWRLALGTPGYLNRYPYTVSIAEDLLGLSDENLDPDGSMSATERAQLRYDLFQQFLQAHSDGETLAFQFTTSIQDSNIFSPNVWNARLTGLGMPDGVPNTQGISLNILTRQFGNVGTPEVILTHGGQASYRTATGEITEYTPDRTKLVGYPLPEGFQQKDTTAVILSSVNGNGSGTGSSALFNLSVAASSWTVELDLNSPLNKNLDISQIEDLVVLMDSTAIALPRLQDTDAQSESQRLIDEFEAAKTRSAIRE